MTMAFMALVSCEKEPSQPVLGLRSNSFGMEGRLTTNKGIPSISDEKYPFTEENPFVKTRQGQTSSFSINADGASFSNVRRYLINGQLPPSGAIRVEEMVNYFTYDYASPQPDENISVTTELTTCPWQKGHALLSIGLKGKEISREMLPPANFVLVVDVSGSMSMDGKMDLLKQSLELLVENLREEDWITIVTYSGTVSVELPTTSGAEKQIILDALHGLETGGVSAGSKGLETAFQMAAESFVGHGINRIILATDGDFNNGYTSQGGFLEYIRRQGDMGIYLTVVGLGADNLNDALLEQITNAGNGTYEYLDSYAQANKVFNLEYNKFFPVASDIDISISFDATNVESYRLIGYENAAESKVNPKKQDCCGGHISAGQTIVALYELVLSQADRQDIATVELNYKKTGHSQNRFIQHNVAGVATSFDQSSENMRFAVAIALYSLKLGNSLYQGNATYNESLEWMRGATNFDPHGLRKEFVNLVRGLELEM
jgi:Ca-activated chloride channel homolog